MTGVKLIIILKGAGEIKLFSLVFYERPEDNSENVVNLKGKESDYISFLYSKLL